MIESLEILFASISLKSWWVAFVLDHDFVLFGSKCTKNQIASHYEYNEKIEKKSQTLGKFAKIRNDFGYMKMKMWLLQIRNQS